MVSRSPLSFVQNIIIIFGGIFIGQNAVEANIIGTTSIIVTSLSYVTSFAVTNNSYLITEELLSTVELGSMIFDPEAEKTIFLNVSD